MKNLFIRLKSDLQISKVRTQKPYGVDWNDHKVKKGMGVILKSPNKTFFGVILSTSIKIDPYLHLPEFKKMYPADAAFEMVIDVRKVLNNGF